jgi:hypothetical protein
MKKVLITVLMVAIAWGVFAQAVDTSKIDMSKAKMSLAGPDSVYVTNIYYDTTRISVLLKYNGGTGATIYGPYYDSDKLLLDSFDFGYADLRILGDDTLIISDLILYGQGVSGRFKYDGQYTLDLSKWWQTMTPKTNEMRLAELETQLDTSQKRYEQEITATKGKYEADIAELTEEKSDLQNQLNSQNRMIESGRRQYENQIASLRRQLESAGVEAETTDVMVTARPTRRVFSGFARGTEVGGNWTASANSLTSSDSSALYAKYAIRTSQSADQTLYEFTAQAGSGATEKVGYGLHFFASGDMAKASYGYGSSYLVWITRDPAFYRNDSTYVQIYGSYDDVTMYQIASVATTERVTAANDVEILYDKANGQITVTVNGTDYLVYNVPVVIRNGSKVAFRTMGGPVTFRNFEIKVQ